ncbi:amidohydrolase family protein [Massilia sp. CFBP9012]|uniref:amidohydrolase family protein n=1 Tax=Massilia sp. CFBP9012 TaxID=3096531 RepID=UPI002A6A8170|nr:amidohydrolase family protein [Massilia sp. CFBP9012]MDY0973587.1 amidohydrolase family protein [Massilia sp. CFBP9012]
MRRLSITTGAIFCAAMVVAASGPACADEAQARPRPAADHHQHLFSPAAAAWMSSSIVLAPVDADALVAQLDAAGIGRAAVLSAAYAYGLPARAIDHEYARVRAENDWVAAQAARHPERLVALCSFNPPKDYALLELGRCATSPGFGRGIKLDFAASDVQLDQSGHVERLRQVFRAANARGMAIVMDMRASRALGRPYGAAQAHVLLEQVLPYAPDVPVQVSHLAGNGPGFGDTPAREALAVLAEAAARQDPRMRQVWFDVAAVVQADLPADEARRLVRRLRQLGLDRVLYGSDPRGDNEEPDGWEAFLRLPLEEAETARVARNVVPYLR